MTEKEQSTSKNTDQNIPDNPFPTVPDNIRVNSYENSNDAKSYYEQGPYSTTNDEQIPYIKNPLIVKIEEKNDWKKADIIEVIGIIIGVIVMWITIDTFRQTKRSVDIAEQSLKDARKKDSISDVRDSIRNIAEQERYEISRIKDSVSTSLSKQSLSAQVNSIKESQIQFAIGNEPYLQITAPQMEYKIGELPVIRYSIENLSRYPVKVTDRISWAKLIENFGKNQYTVTGITKTAFTKQNTYIINGTPVDVALTFQYTLTDQEYKSVITHKLFAYYMFIEINYINLVTKEKKVYKCGIKIAPLFNKTTYSEYIINENKKLPK